MFQSAVPEFHIRWHGGGKLDQWVVKERHARLQTVGHAHSVLDVQECGQQALEVEMRHAIEIGLLPNIAFAVEDFAEGF